MRKVFNNQALTDNDAVNSILFPLGGSIGVPSQISVNIGCTSDSATDDNMVSIRMYVSPDWYSEDDPGADATWFELPQSLFKTIYIHVGESYGVGILGSGNEYIGMQEMLANYQQCKLVAQRHQISAAGTNTINIDAWVTN